MMVLGGVDKNRMLDEPLWIQRRDKDWTFVINSVQLGSNTLNTRFEVSMMLNFNDFTFLPFDLASSINTMLGMKRAEGLYHNSAGWSADCSSIKDESVIFNLDFNNTRLEFRRLDYIFRITEDNKTTCWSSIFGIVSDVIKPSIGTILLKNKYVVFDYDKGFMGLGKSDPNSEIRPNYVKYSYEGPVIKNELSKSLFIVLIVLASTLVLMLLLIMIKSLFSRFGQKKRIDLRKSRSLSPKKNEFVPIRNRQSFNRSNQPAKSPRNSMRRDSGEAPTITPRNTPVRESIDFESPVKTRFQKQSDEAVGSSPNSARSSINTISPQNNPRRQSYDKAISRDTGASGTDSDIYSQIQRQSPRFLSTQNDSVVIIDQSNSSSKNSQEFPDRFSRLPTLVVPASPTGSMNSITTLTKQKKTKK